LRAVESYENADSGGESRVVLDRQVMWPVLFLVGTN
jgi:hypothetical protein